MPNPPYSGFILIAVEGQDGVRLEAWAYDERIATTVAEMNANAGSRIGYSVPNSPVGLRETLANATEGATRYFQRSVTTRTAAKTASGQLIDAVFPDTAA